MHRTGKASTGNQALNQVWHAARRSGWQAIAAASAAILLAGCGASYRPVVSAINLTGPAGQPTKYAVAISNPTVTGQGLVTIVDFSGDTVLATPSILTGPNYFTLGNGGSQAYVTNAAGALDTFAVSNPTNLQTSNVAQTTLVAGADPVSITPVSGTGSGTVIFIPQAGGPSVAALSSNGPSLLQNLSVGANPNFVVGTTGTARVYALSGGPGVPGQVAAIETTSSLPTISATLTVGENPIYGVMTADLQRAYILSKGANTVSVINVPTNTFDATTPTIPTQGISPVWAVPVLTRSELVVLNAGDGTNPGSLSMINIALCNAATLPTNPNCNKANPTDSTDFGTVLATVPVGVNPTMVDVLNDGSRAYVVNQSNLPGVCGGQGSVSVVNLSANQVTATVCAIPDNGTLTPSSNPNQIFGTPNTLSVTSGDPTGKVYITSYNSKYMTVLRTDLDTVQTHISLQGTGIPLPPAGSNHPQSPGVLVTQP